jgi:methionine-R-sulfoxide reductase
MSGRGGYGRYVALEGGTEKPFDNPYWDNHAEGVYVGIIGGLPLFSSDAKFDSGTGWPSFFEPIDPTHVLERVDRAHGMARTEVLDARSGAHLGHVFDDGYVHGRTHPIPLHPARGPMDTTLTIASCVTCRPLPSGRRYCMNSAAMRFVPKGEPLPGPLGEL